MTIGKVANQLLTKMLTLTGAGRYRAEYGRPETPTKQAYWVPNGIGRDTTDRPMPDSKPSTDERIRDKEITGVSRITNSPWGNASCSESGK